MSQSWAADGSLTATNKAMGQKLARRIMTTDDVRKSQMHQGGQEMRQTRNSQYASHTQHPSKRGSAVTGPIGVPLEMSVGKIIRNKNDSGSLNSMIHGDVNGYTVGTGIQNELFKTRPKMK